jgi:predicted SprT family Zn-dependent metalloprotease
MDIKQAENIAIELMNKHDLCKARGKRHWKFKFDKSVSRFGLCSYRKRTISISRQLTELNSESEFIDTVLHEIAHALHWLEGNRGGHDARWKKIATEIGCNGQRCYGQDVITMKKAKGCCPMCGKEILRHRKNEDLFCLSCWNQNVHIVDDTYQLRNKCKFEWFKL